MHDWLKYFATCTTKPQSSSQTWGHPSDIWGHSNPTKFISINSSTESIKNFQKFWSFFTNEPYWKLLENWSVFGNKLGYVFRKSRITDIVSWKPHPYLAIVLDFFLKTGITEIDIWKSHRYLVMSLDEFSCKWTLTVKLFNSKTN